MAADTIIDKKRSITLDTTVDLETAINITGFGKFNWFMILLTFPVACTFVFATGHIAYVISVAASDLDITETGKAWLMSACYGGMVISGYIWGSLSDAFGRKNLMVFGFLTDFALNIGVGFAKTFPIMLSLKFLSGFIIAGPYLIFMVYISEVFPQRYRDMIVQLIGLFSTLGSIIQVGLATWIIPMYIPDWLPLKTWQIYMMTGGIPALIIGISCIFFYESPKFLLDKGRSEQALTVCRNIFTINTGLSCLSFPVSKIDSKIKVKSDSGMSMRICLSIWNQIVAIFRPPYLFKAFMAFTIFVVLSLQTALRIWMPEILTLLQKSYSSDTGMVGLCPLLAKNNMMNSTESTLPENSVYLSMAVINCGCLVFHLLFALAVKCLRMKILFILSIIIAGCSILAVPWISARLSLVPISLYIALYDACLYAFFGVIVQVFPTHLRAKAVAMASVLGRIAMFLSNFLFCDFLFTRCNEVFWSLAGISLGIIILSSLLSFKPHDDSKIS